MLRYSSLLIVAAALAAGSATGAADEHDCMIEARQTVEIRSSVEAVIESVPVRRGQLVRKGQVVATLESGPERAALALAQTRAANQGDIKLAEARLDIATKKLRRAEDLFKQGFISANSRDEAHSEYRLASEDTLRARENQRLAELEAKRAGEVLAMRTIRSPITGVVVDVLRRPGEFGAITFKDPIMTLAEIHPLHVEAILPFQMYGKVKVGQKAQVMPEQPIGGRYETVITVVDRVVDAASGTLGVRLELPNPKGVLPAGVRCRVLFQ